MEGTEVLTFGDARRLILNTIMDLRSGKMEPARGMAIAACTKTLNDSVQVEINASKLAWQTAGTAHEFGRVVSMGQRLISNGSSQPA